MIQHTAPTLRLQATASADPAELRIGLEGEYHGR